MYTYSGLGSNLSVYGGSDNKGRSLNVSDCGDTGIGIRNATANISVGVSVGIGIGVGVVAGVVTSVVTAVVFTVISTVIDSSFLG